MQPEKWREIMGGYKACAQVRDVSTCGTDETYIFGPSKKIWTGAVLRQTNAKYLRTEGPATDLTQTNRLAGLILIGSQQTTEGSKLKKMPRAYGSAISITLG